MKKSLFFALALVSLSFTPANDTISKKERDFAVKLLKDTENDVLTNVKGLSDNQLKYKPAPDRWKGIAEPGSALATGLDAVTREDKSFDAKHFLTGARSAYDMIVTAYAAGDRRQLKGLLGREVYDGFESAIKEREGRGDTVETRFVAIDGADFVAAEMRAKTAQVTVRFQSQLVSVTRAKDGAVIDGNPDKVTDVTDVWTFARDISSRDPNWKLVATEAGQ